MSPDALETIYQWIGRLIVLFTAMPIHESAHGYAAHRLGDNTAKEQGRLTLNPFAHLDLLGSLLLVLAGFGWAKPVPVNPNNFKKPKQGMAITALAGPVSNLLMALLFMIVFKLLYSIWPVYRETTWMYPLLQLLSEIFAVNVYLAVFNLLPVPPLDGSKIFGALLPDRIYFSVMRYERWIGIALFVLIYFQILSGPLQFLAQYVFYLLDWLTSFLGRLYI